MNNDEMREELLTQQTPDAVIKKIKKYESLKK
jgi:hypothetical protein